MTISYRRESDTWVAPFSERLRCFRHADGVIRQAVGAGIRQHDTGFIPRKAIQIALVRLIDSPTVRTIAALDELAHAALAILQDAQVGALHHDGTVASRMVAELPPMESCT